MVNARSKSDRLFDIINVILLIITGVAIIYPLYYVLIASVSNPVYISRGEIFLYPKGLNVYGYMKLIDDKSVWIGYRNTIFYTLLGTFINLAVTLPCAFALSRKSMPFRSFFGVFFIFTMYFSGGMIPAYMLNRSLGIVDTVWVLVLPGAMSAYNMIIARNFYISGIPDSIFESAIIDGASKFKLFFQFALPLSSSMTAVIALYYALGHWNSYLHPFIYINTQNKLPLQVIVRRISAALDASLSDTLDPSEVNRMMLEKQLIKYAVVVVSSLPVFLMYPWVQKYFVKGVMIGAVKG